MTRKLLQRRLACDHRTLQKFWAGTGATRAQRRMIAVSLSVAVIALVVAAVAVVAGLRTGGGDEQRDRSHDAAQAAAAATAELMTFAPGDDPQRRAGVAAQLTGVLRADYERSGPDAVVPGAVAAGTAMTTRITAAATQELRGDRARVLVFYEQQTSREQGDGAEQRDRAGDGAGESESRGGARWATVEYTGGTWLLVRLEPVL